MITAGIALGLLMLIAGGAALVTGASSLAARFGVSPIVIGLTIVAFGTSAPELVVNIAGSMRGESELAFGNVVGSNVANLALVLGVAALFRPIDIRSGLVRREVPLLLLITTILIAMALDPLLDSGTALIDRSDAVILLLLFGVFVYTAVSDMIQPVADDPLIADIDDSPMVVNEPTTGWAWLWVIPGLALLGFGGDLTVRSSAELATQLGIAASLVGMFVVGVGTSLPELVTSAVAAARRESDLALGNVVGSNIFNALTVLPASALVGAIPIPRGGVADLGFSWLLTAALVPLFYFGKARLGRRVGIVLVVAYFAYAAFRLG